MSKFGKSVIAGAREALGHARGEGGDGYVIHTPDALIAWRKRLGLSQPEAAARLSLPVGTYRGYEQDRRAIPGPVAALATYVEAVGWPVPRGGANPDTAAVIAPDRPARRSTSLPDKRGGGATIRAK